MTPTLCNPSVGDIDTCPAYQAPCVPFEINICEHDDTDGPVAHCMDDAIGYDDAEPTMAQQAENDRIARAEFIAANMPADDEIGGWINRL